MQPDAVLSLFRSVGALLEGHFRLSSGLHSNGYMQSALVLQHPDHAAALGRALADAVRALDPHVVLSPALGGLIIGHEVARALGVRAIFAERVDGVLTLRRGFSLAAAERVLVVEDVVTTGKSTRETIAVAEAAGATVVGAAGIINRGGDVDLGVPFTALATVSFPTWPADQIPDWLAAVPVTKPGSRPGPEVAGTTTPESSSTPESSCARPAMPERRPSSSRSPTTAPACVGWQRQAGGHVGPGPARGRPDPAHGHRRGHGDGRRAHRRRRPCPRAGGQHDAGDAAGAGRSAARRQRAPAGRRPRARGRDGRRHLPRPLRRQGEALRLPRDPRPADLAVRRALRLAHPLSARRRGDAGGAAGAARPPRFRRISVNRVRYTGHRADAERGAARRGTGGGRRHPARPHARRGRLPAPHGPGHRRQPGRGRPRALAGRADRRRSWPRRTGPRRGRRRPPHGLFLVSVRYC